MSLYTARRCPLRGTPRAPGRQKPACGGGGSWVTCAQRAASHCDRAAGKPPAVGYGRRLGRPSASAPSTAFSLCRFEWLCAGDARPQSTVNRSASENLTLQLQITPTPLAAEISREAAQGWFAADLRCAMQAATLPRGNLNFPSKTRLCKESKWACERGCDAVYGVTRPASALVQHLE